METSFTFNEGNFYARKKKQIPTTFKDYTKLHSWFCRHEIKYSNPGMDYHCEHLISAIPEFKLPANN